jgi:hypothetical protein
MKILECRERNIHDVGFIDPNVINCHTIENNPREVEDLLLMFLTQQNLNSDIIFPYNFK